MKRSKFEWKSINPNDLWYLVGLISSDGSLSKDGRHVDITSIDREFLEKIVTPIGLVQGVSPKSNGRNRHAFRIQVSSVDFYRFLVSIGLEPNKSKTIGGLKVPSAFFVHFLRGVIDGDGEIRRWIHPTNGGEQWAVRIVCGSGPFLDWIQKNVSKIIGVSGVIYEDNLAGVCVLKYGKLAAIEILKKCYIQQGSSLRLERKYNLAKDCISSRKGWTKSKTTKNARVVELVDTQDSGKWVSSVATRR